MKYGRAALIGETDLLLQCQNLLERSGIDVVAIYSEDPHVNRSVTNKSVLHSSINNFGSWVIDNSVDYLFSIVNPLLIPNNVLESISSFAINYHDSLLPSYAGSHAAPWSIYNNERVTGITFHLMNSKSDSGDILLQQAVKIDEHDTVEAVNKKCGMNALFSFNKLVSALINDKIEPRKQDSYSRSFFHRYKRIKPAGLVTSPIDAHLPFIKAHDYGQSFNPICIPKMLVDGIVYHITKDSNNESGYKLTHPSVTLDGSVSLENIDEVDNQVFPNERRWMNFLRSNPEVSGARKLLCSNMTGSNRKEPEYLNSLDSLMAYINDKNVFFWFDAEKQLDSTVFDSHLYEHFLPIGNKELVLEETEKYVRNEFDTFLIDLYERTGVPTSNNPDIVNIVLGAKGKAYLGFDYVWVVNDG